MILDLVALILTSGVGGMVKVVPWGKAYLLIILPLLNASKSANQSFAIHFVERKVQSWLKIGWMMGQRSLGIKRVAC